MDLQSFQTKHLAAVETTMLTFLRGHSNEELLYESMCYSIEAGGKRLRPLLFLLCCELCGGVITQKHYEVAAALEMIHTYSLIHDDLPAMDNDDLRRGRPTNHIVYGDALAILAGDGLLTAAFQLLSSASFENLRVQIQLLQFLGEAAGAEGMVAGQVADIEGELQELSLAQLKRVHARKTGALLTFATEGAGLIEEMSKEICLLLRKFGEYFGVAFQIRDDLLDVVGKEEKIGKKTGKDFQLHKSTYPALLGLTGAYEALDSEIAGATKCLDELQVLLPNSDVTKLSEIVEMLKQI